MAVSKPLDPRRLLPIGRCGWLVRTPGFTAGEVRELLREGAGSERGRAVSRCAARAADWLPENPDVVRCPFYYRQHLPRIIFWYARGDSVETIGRRLSAFGTPWGVERALKTACRRMAACLNDDPAAYGLAR
ncbi:MAG: hypothetical protein AVDCRST_MAG88-464 [uncultured Thermomicrobiales bacterium]|uniref:Uncharacterized protein n=1 Tax=uncultured Thermomicrobiales bacterium TaxID=1645740 RepID=A0A6J4UF29_9BACT|nr:MAG: hypothetical protein AVDCRST_MAG88-464 [uncultured Thermomicrobiales bacterium]